MTGSVAHADPDVAMLQFHHGPDGVIFGVRTTTGTADRVAVWWPSDRVTMVPDTAGTTHLAGDSEQALLQAAMDTWNQATATCGGVELALAAAEPGEVGYDRVHRVVFREDRWCAPVDCERYCGPADECEAGESCHNPVAAGLTTLCFNRNTGEILDADVELNGVDFAISSDGVTLAPDRPLADLGNTFTHELGHVHGLDHTCWTGSGRQPVDIHGDPAPSCNRRDLPPSVTEATMFPTQADGERSKITLEPDDIASVCAIEPPPDGCGCTGSSPGSSLWLAALIACAATRRRRGQSTNAHRKRRLLSSMVSGSGVT